jgi:transcriptional regulator with XRE-family HTH domain
MKPIIDGERLRALREARSWDKRTLAQQAGISASVVTRLERGSQADLRVSVLLALARTLEIEPGTLLTANTLESGQAQPDLEAAFREASRMAPNNQRHLASLMRIYVLELPEP